MIPLFKPYMAVEAAEEVAKVLSSGYIGEGPKVAEFEATLGAWIGSKEFLAVNSCTSALAMALRLAGVGPKDFVISTPMTCLATNEPILERGAIPIWADVDSTTGNINVDSVERILQRADSHNFIDRIKAVMIVHWGGYPCDLSELRAITSVYGIPIIEDAAHAFGSVYKGNKIGSDFIEHDYVCFSFQAIKHITCGDGGALIVPKEQYDRARLMRWFGLDRTTGASMRCLQDPPEYGYKYHMNDIAATIGLANFKYVGSIGGQVYNTAGHYNDAFKGLANVRLPEYDTDRLSTYWLYSINVDTSEHFIKYMADNGVECSKVHTRNDTKSMFKMALRDTYGLKGVSDYDEKHVCIPVGYHVSNEDRDKIVELVRRY